MCWKCAAAAVHWDTFSAAADSPRAFLAAATLAASVEHVTGAGLPSESEAAAEATLGASAASEGSRVASREESRVGMSWGISAEAPA